MRCEKVCYANIYKAIHAIKEARKHGDQMKAYRCSQCGGRWHIGHRSMKNIPGNS